MARGIRPPAMPFNFGPSPSREEVVQGGQVLFENFVYGRFQAEGVTENELNAGENGDVAAGGDAVPNALPRNWGFRLQNPGNIPKGYRTQAMITLATYLDETAVRFEGTMERVDVFNKANEVDLNDIDRESFWEFLQVYFGRGVTKANLVVLFYFCSDVIIRALKLNHRQIFLHLITWSLEFIATRVCDWVYAHGGWDAVLNKCWGWAQRLLVFSVGIAFVVGIATYAKDKWPSPK